MKRRELLFASGALLAVSLAHAQQAGRSHRIGLLTPSPWSQAPWDEFLQEMARLGWSAGKNLLIERRSAEGKSERLPALAAELVALGPEVIVTFTTPAMIALQQATGSIPIVGAAIANPTATGVAASLSRPGANVTGISSFASELNAKRLQLLRETVPSIKRVAVLVSNPANPATAAALAEIRDAAGKLSLAMNLFAMPSAAELEAVLARAESVRPDALFLPNEPELLPHRERLAAFALKHRLPSAFGYPSHVEAGGLLAYAPSYPDLFRRAASYADRILRGAKPSDLPIEQASKFELVINVKTAKALGLTIPASILLRADRVIE